MPRLAAISTARRAINITLSAELLIEARQLGLNVSQACERGLKVEVARCRAAQWKEENRDALASSNEYVSRNGLPLANFTSSDSRFDVYQKPDQDKTG